MHLVPKSCRKLSRLDPVSRPSCPRTHRNVLKPVVVVGRLRLGLLLQRWPRGLRPLGRGHQNCDWRGLVPDRHALHHIHGIVNLDHGLHGLGHRSVGLRVVDQLDFVADLLPRLVVCLYLSSRQNELIFWLNESRQVPFAFAFLD